MNISFALRQHYSFPVFPVYPKLVLVLAACGGQAILTVHRPKVEAQSEDGEVSGQTSSRSRGIGVNDLSVIQQAVAGEASLYDQAAAILLSDAMEIVTSYGPERLSWQETLWAAQLAMEEVFAFDAMALTEDGLHTAMSQKILRIMNGLDCEQLDGLSRRPDAYVNRVFGME